MPRNFRGFFYAKKHQTNNLQTEAGLNSAQATQLLL